MSGTKQVHEAACNQHRAISAKRTVSIGCFGLERRKIKGVERVNLRCSETVLAFRSWAVSSPWGMGNMACP
jgi:hypothetical protein